MPYRLSPLAEQDLEKIWSYVADDASADRADRLLDAIVHRFDMLAEYPRMGRLRPEFGPGVRSLAVENHVIYYREETELLIARVLHGRRDQAAAWQESPESKEQA
jgi:toxin ParE1/3/4